LHNNVLFIPERSIRNENVEIAVDDRLASENFLIADDQGAFSAGSCSAAVRS
jgi:hypothetical protein